MYKRIVIDYYTDMLCVWAYFSQIKLDELKKAFGKRIQLNYHFITLFGNNEIRIAQGYEEGGYQGYSRHVLGLQEHFPHVEIHPDIWTRNIPVSSMPVHLTLKAVQLLEEKGELPESTDGSCTLFEELVWQLRLSFFSKLQNIADEQILQAQLEALNISVQKVETEIRNGNAYAALALDIDEQRSRMIEGSPTWIMNEGRQRLYGNIGYRAIAANIQELLERKIDLPDWC
jgi:predicted DsbA family dithiol-disulfide isomerase